MSSHTILFQVADASLRGVALAGMAALLSLFFRRSAALQHALWMVVAAGMLAMPVLRVMVPPARVMVVPQRIAPAMPVVADRVAPGGQGARRLRTAQPAG